MTDLETGTKPKGYRGHILKALFVLAIAGAIAWSFYWYGAAKHEVKRVQYIVQDMKSVAGARGSYRGLTSAEAAKLGIGKQIGEPAWVNKWGGEIHVQPLDNGSRFRLIDHNLPPRACSDLAVIETPYNMGKIKDPNHSAPFAVWVNGTLVRAWGGDLNKWAISRACDHPSNIVTMELE